MVCLHGLCGIRLNRNSPNGNRMTDVTVTADQLEEAIANALKAGDIPAVGTLLKSLALLDAPRAENMLGLLRLGVEIGRTKASGDGNTATPEKEAE